MEIVEVNIKSNMPTVEVALRQLEMEMDRYRRRYNLMKIVHGYGSTGVGGKIRSAVRKSLQTKRTAGSIRDFIPGENFSMYESSTQKWLADYHKELTNDRDYEQFNRGITIVIL